jgi:hypothetical protein
MTPYATYAQFTQVYSIKGVSQEEIENYWLQHGSLRVNESLGGYFTTPFSTSNHTARDLSIHFAFLGIQSRARTGQTADIKIKQELEERVTDIREGNTPMIFDNGSAIFASTAKVDAWSSTQDYIPVFNMLDPVEQEVDPDLIEDLRNEQI